MLRRSLIGALALAIAFAPARPLLASQDPAFADTAVATSGVQLMQIYNLALKAAESCNSGASAPANLQAGAEAAQCWADTSVSGYVIIRRYDGTSANWIETMRLDTTNHILVAAVGGGTIPTLLSATTTDLGSVPQPTVNISGTTTITSLGSSAQPGTRHTFIFQGALTLTHNATSLILPGSQPIPTAAGDIGEAIYLGSGNWRVVNYTKADGTAVANPAVPLGTAEFNFAGALPTGHVYGYGQALTRTSFPQYLAAVTKAVTATRTSGNATLASIADTSMFGVGMPVEGSGITAGCTVASIVANTSITLNSGSCVTANGSTTVTVFLTGYGSGGDSTTVGVPDCAGRMLAGRTDASGTDNSRITTAAASIDGKALGASGGAQTLTMAQANMPNVTLGVSIVDPSHLHASNAGAPVAAQSGTSFNVPLFGSTATSSSPTGISATTASVNGGVTQTAMNKMAPTLIANCTVRVTP